MDLYSIAGWSLLAPSLAFVVIVGAAVGLECARKCFAARQQRARKRKRRVS